MSRAYGAFGDLRDEARAVFDRCDPATPRLEVVWAAAVFICDRVARIAALPTLPPQDWSYFGGDHRRIDCGTEGLSIRCGGKASPLVVPVVTYAEITDLVAVDDDLRQRVESAARCGDRREGRHLIVRVWQRCRPGVTRQLDMLDLIGPAS